MVNKKYLVFLLLAAFLCLGMGTMGDGGVEIPKTSRNYSATLVDRSGLSIDLDHFSFEGKTFFYGKLGMAEASVDFDKIKSIKFNRGDTGKVLATIDLADGKKVTLAIKKDMSCYGSSSVADIKIDVADIAEIEMHGAPFKKRKGK